MLRSFTKKDYLEVLEKIKSVADDDPAQAHIYEDEVKNKFILELSKRDDKIGEVAKVLMEINNIDYPRWYN